MGKAGKLVSFCSTAARTDVLEETLHRQHPTSQQEHTVAYAHVASGCYSS